MFPAFSSFFEELDFDTEPSETRETRRRPRLPRRGGRGGGDDGHDEPTRTVDAGGGGGRRTQGLQRLAILAGVLLLLVAVGLWQVRRCQRDEEVRSYRNYVGDTNEIARQSATIGKQFTDAFLQSGQTPDGLREAIDGASQKQAQLVRTAQGLGAPGDLSPLQPFLVQSMQYRVSGLQAMSKALQQATGGQAAEGGAVSDENAAAVAATFQRLIASDVVYSDSYQEPAKRALADEGIEGVSVDGSDFVGDATFEIVSPQRMQSLLERMVAGGGEGTPATDAVDEDGDGVDDNTNEPIDDGAGGAHGNSLVSVSIQPADVQLSPDEVVEVETADQNEFVVTFENSGDFTESSIQVKTVLNDVALETQTVPVLEAGETAEVRVPFSNDVPNFSGETTAQVTVEPVQGETNVDNNQARFEILFTLPPG